MKQEERMDYAIVAQVAMDWAMDESTNERLEHPLKDCEQAIRDLLEETSSLGEELTAEAARTAEEKLRADQMTEQHRMQTNMRKEIEEENQQLRGQYDAAASVVAELQAQLSAIGAGGVESLRKPSPVDSASQYATTEESASVMRSTPETPAEKLVNQMIEDRWLNEQGVAPEAYTRGLFDIAAELAANMQAAQPSREGLQQIAELPDCRGRVMVDEDGECGVSWRGGMPPENGTNIYTEQQVRALQAVPPAQADVAVPDAKGREK